MDKVKNYLIAKPVWDLDAGKGEIDFGRAKRRC